MIFKLIYPEFWRRKGVLNYLLLPVSLIFILLGYLRRIFVKPIKFPAKVICIGNVTVGGTGKTQIVKWIAEELNKNDRNYVIVSKSYASSLNGAQVVLVEDDPQIVGDEAKLLSKYGTVVSASKPKYALPLIEILKPEIVIFDDGLQNPGFYKDVSVIAIDSVRGLGNEMIIPAGPMRTSLNCALKKVDAIAFTGNEYIDNPQENQQIKDISSISNVPILHAKTKIIHKLKKDQEFLAFSGISDPEKFFGMLESNGCKLKIKKSYPDHYCFSKHDIYELKKLAQEQNLLLITTEKDFIKLPSFENIICVEVGLEFKDNKLLKSILFGE